MKKLLTGLAVCVAALSLVGGYANTAAAAPTRSTCSDVGYLNSAVKSSKKSIAALKLAQKSRWSAAIAPARTALWLIKRSAVPCDENSKDYWLHRQYKIKYAVALVRYLEESSSGDFDSADIYWSSVKFWSDSISDITYAW